MPKFTRIYPPLTWQQIVANRTERGWREREWPETRERTTQPVPMEWQIVKTKEAK